MKPDGIRAGVNPITERSVSSKAAPAIARADGRSARLRSLGSSRRATEGGLTSRAHPWRRVEASRRSPQLVQPG